MMLVNLLGPCQLSYCIDRQSAGSKSRLHACNGGVCPKDILSYNFSDCVHFVTRFVFVIVNDDSV